MLENCKYLAVLLVGLSGCVQQTPSLISAPKSISSIVLTPIDATIISAGKVKIRASLRNNGSQDKCYWIFKSGTIFVAIGSPDGQALIPGPDTPSSEPERMIEQTPGDTGPFKTEVAVKQILKPGVSVTLEGVFDEPIEETYHTVGNGFGKNYQSHDQLVYLLQVAVSPCELEKFYWEFVTTLDSDRKVNVRF